MLSLGYLYLSRGMKARKLPASAGLQTWIWELSLELRVSSRRLTRVLVQHGKDGGHRGALRSFA